MKPMTKISIPAMIPLTFLISAAVLSSCATADFKPYVGQQQDWPTAPGAIMDTKYVVPVYYGPPPRPYKIVGYLDATTAPVRRRGVVSFAARRAKEMGGDAIIIASKGLEYAGNYTTSSASTQAVYTGQRIGNTYYGRGNAFTSEGSASAALYRGTASVIVIKFRQ